MEMERSEHGAWKLDDAECFTRIFTGRISQYGLTFMDEAGRITGWSEGCHRLTGFTADDVLGASVALLFTPDDVAREIHVHELNGAAQLGGAEDERWHMRKDGSKFWASGVTLSMWTGDSLRGFAKIFRDATHLRLRTKTLENEVMQLKKEQHDRDVFLATIAHELRNPLQPMSVATRLLSHPSERIRHEQAVKILDRQLGFIGRLVEDLIDLTRAGEGKMGVAYETVELQRLLQEAIESCRSAAEAAGVALLGILPPKPISIEVDPGRMNQVIVNLLNNAIKFTPSGGRVSVLANVDQTHFQVKVMDTGCGIGPELQPKIFDMFTQASTEGTKRGQGLGIGLALVKEIVSLHRGTVEVRSEGHGKGSDFFVRVPLIRPSTPAGGGAVAQ